MKFAAKSAVRRVGVAVTIGLAVASGSAAIAAPFAYAATHSFTQPTTNPFTVPEVQSGPQAGTPETFPVAGTGYTPPGTPVYIEICDGVPSSNPNWDPLADCDLGTSPAPSSVDSNGNVSWDGSKGNAIGIFRGQGPSQAFNCVAPQDVPNGTPPNPDGSYNLDGVNGGLTQNGEPLAQGVESWTNCQLRMSTNNQAATTDQVFITLTIPNTPTGVPEASFPVLLPIGAAGLLAAGVIVTRRRRRSHRIAA